MKMSRSVFFFCFLLLVLASPAHAHQVKTDGNMSVLLHTDPNDDPYAGATALLHFVFTDTEKRFHMEACECEVYIAPYDLRDAIEEEGIQYDLNAPEITRQLGSFTVAHVFPRRDVYRIEVKGAPRDGVSFDPFTILYDLRVAKGENVPVPVVTSRVNTDSFRTGVLTTLAAVFFIVVGILIQRLVFKK